VPKYRLAKTDRTVLVATCRLVTPQLLRELPVVHQSQTGTPTISPEPDQFYSNPVLGFLNHSNPKVPVPVRFANFVQMFTAFHFFSFQFFSLINSQILLRYR
jgi:hypothetical protein